MLLLLAPCTNVLWSACYAQLIQRRCKVCNGSGLVARGKGQRKCPECGGFFPWISWRMFLSANARPGNGGEHTAAATATRMVAGCSRVAPGWPGTRVCAACVCATSRALLPALSVRHACAVLVRVMAPYGNAGQDATPCSLMCLQAQLAVT